MTNLLPRLDYSDKSWGTYEGDEFSIEFSKGEKQMVDSIMLHVRDEGKATEVINIIMNKLKCAALDCSTNEFMEKNKINENSWIKFQEYRDSILKEQQRNMT